MPEQPRSGTRSLARCRKFWQAACSALYERPLIVVAALVAFAALLAIGLSSVLTAAAVSVRNSKDLAAHGLGYQVAQSMKEAMLIATFGAELLATVVTRQPSCATLAAEWDDISADIMSKVDTEVVKQLELSPAGIIWKTYPPLEGDLAKILYGRNMFKDPDDRPGMLYIVERKQTVFVGPFNCKEGFKCAFAATPIFLPAPSEDFDWGCGRQPYNCTDLCWDPVRKVKLWGEVNTMLNLDPLLSGQDFRLRVLAERGYNYKLWQANTSVSNPYFVLSNATQQPTDPVVLEIAAYNVIWYLELAPASGWVPAWRDPCIAVVVVGSAVVAVLVLWLLVTKEQHNILLRAMLPPEVIKQLQAGDTSIAQEYDDVTILFSDIVGYTCVASQLSPRQVITLLNELFSVFDELTQRNGVYKVETIGDALMCVAGCPVPDDAVSNAVRMANMALDMVQAVEQFRPSLEGVRVQIRVGIHSGPVVAGVVGKKMPRYCLFGDTVNTSSRMESTSEPMRIQISASTAALLRTRGCLDFEVEPRGPISVKGKGTMETFWLCPGLRSCPRGKSFLAMLRRPVSIVILPPPPGPAPARLSLRAMTYSEPGKALVGEPSSARTSVPSQRLCPVRPASTGSIDMPPAALQPPSPPSPASPLQDREPHVQMLLVAAAGSLAELPKPGGSPRRGSTAVDIPAGWRAPSPANLSPSATMYGTHVGSGGRGAAPSPLSQSHMSRPASILVGSSLAGSGRERVLGSCLVGGGRSHSSAQLAPGAGRRHPPPGVGSEIRRSVTPLATSSGTATPARSAGATPPRSGGRGCDAAPPPASAPRGRLPSRLEALLTIRPSFGRLAGPRPAEPTHGSGEQPPVAQSAVTGTPERSNFFRLPSRGRATMGSGVFGGLGATAEEGAAALAAEPQATPTLTAEPQSTPTLTITGGEPDCKAGRTRRQAA